MVLPAKPRPSGRGWLWAILIAAALLRVVALSSDAYPRLDWSAALLTDEGFYIHNARNVALFGHPRTDDFNNMLLSPLFHSVQVGVFSLFGTGVVQARSISVVCSLLTLVLLWSALRRAFDERVALTAVLFLALDHTSLLYHRLALLDTPACLPAVAAFYAFVRGCESGSTENRAAQNRWLFVSGLLLGVTITNRALAAYMIPAPFIAVWLAGRGRTGTAAILSGLSVVVAVYLAVWYWPHAAEMAAMNRYYRLNQIQPRSLAHLLENIRHAFVGDFRGISPYLFRHSPVVYGLVVAWVVGLVGRIGRIGRISPIRLIGLMRPIRNPATAYLTAWFALGWLMLAVISYSPSRYYVTLYPAMASLAAIALWRVPVLFEGGFASNRWAKVGAAVVGGFAVFHLVLSVVHYQGVLPAAATTLLVYGVPLLVAAGTLAVWQPLSSWMRRHSARVVPALLIAWTVFNAVWLLDWAVRIDYSQIRLSRWLDENLPGNSVLIGDVAPGVSMDNRFKAIHVQPGLANDSLPVERFAGSPRYIVILDGKWKEHYWQDRYPELLDPRRRVRLAHVLRWDVGIYSVDSLEPKP